MFMSKGIKAIVQNISIQMLKMQYLNRLEVKTNDRLRDSMYICMCLQVRFSFSLITARCEL